MPGVTVNVIDSPSGSGIQSDTGKWLVVGQTERGPTNAPVLIRSMSEYATKLGARVSYGFLYDAAETFFKEGGANLYVGRVVGPAPIVASHTFNDATAAPALTVKANGPGAWGNNITVQIVAGVGGGTFVLKVFYNAALVETSPDLADAAAAIAWATSNSAYVVVSDPGAVADPAVVAATALAGGTDDRTNITTTQWQNALALFSADLGFGQVSAPGISTTAIQQAVADHAASLNRIAYLDAANDTSSTNVAAEVTALTGSGLKHSSLLAPWAVIPGLTPSTTRTVPYSAVQAGMTARSDGSGALPNIDSAVAGDNAVAQFATGLTVAWDRTTRDTLNAAGVTPARITNTGEVQTYGDRSLANINTDRAWIEISSGRLFMYVLWAGEEISERYVFKTLDPQGVTIGKYGAELEALMASLSAAGMIFNDPTLAVNVGSQVNTPATIAARELHAELTVQPSEAAEDVILNISAEAA